MSTIQHMIVESGLDSFVTAFVPGHPTPLAAAKSGHPRYDEIVDYLRSGEELDAEKLVNLFDPAVAVAERFDAISDRVVIRGGTLLFDGAPMDNVLTKQILRFLEEDSNFEPLVNFMENLMQNPSERSREQLYEWLDRHDFTITRDGMIVGYKGVASDPDYGYRSISSGSEDVYVELVGEVKVHRGRIPNPIDAIVSMDRGLVEDDASVGCHRGLHVGTYDYAKGFSHGTVLEVHVNPRDVVSVPTECDAQKVRTCRYTVIDAIDEPYSSGLLDPDGGYADEDDEWDEAEFREGDKVRVTAKWAADYYGETATYIRPNEGDGAYLTPERNGLDFGFLGGPANSISLADGAFEKIEDEVQDFNSWDF